MGKNKIKENNNSNNKKQKQQKMTKRSVSNDSHPRHKHNNNHAYHHEYFHHDSPPHLPFSHIRSNPDRNHTNHSFLEAPRQRNRFTRPKSTETPPFQPAPHHQQQQQKIPAPYSHNPYFIAYTP